ncbi:MAG: hypothetical protein GY862_13860 [Gammaproteobacteria bacterium]|nr:hypothetical protein [Gammaproteobacteria bacterium]
MKRWLSMNRKVVFGVAMSMGLAAASQAEFTGTKVDLGDESTWDIHFSGKTDFAYVGTSLAAGDFNGDGTADLAMGAPDENSRRGIENTGAVSVYFGGSAFPSLAEASVDGGGNVTAPDGSTEGMAFYGTQAEEHVGELLEAGDLNGDKIDDLVIVTQHNRDYEKNRIYIVFGKSDLSGNMDPTDADVTLQRDMMHISDLAIGDVNSDGINDLVLSDHLSFGIGRTILGMVYVVFGKTTWNTAIDLGSEADATISRNSGAELFEAEGVAVGDINGDGIDDLIMGASKESNEALGMDAMGRIYVYYGRTAFPAVIEAASDMDVVIQGSRNKEQMGETLAVGDVNDDNIGDLLIGGPQAWQEDVTGTTGYGKIDVVFGSASLGSSLDLLDDADISLTMAEGTLGIYPGTALLAADINGDNIDDIVVGARTPASGWVQVFYGGPSLSGKIKMDESADLWIEAPAPPHLLSSGRLGSTVAVGDLDADGKLDLAMGAPEGAVFGKVSSGYVLVTFDPTTKGGSATACDPNVTAYVDENYTLFIPEVQVPLMGSFYISLQIDVLSFQFVLRNDYGPASVSLCKPATFDMTNGQLNIPSFMVGATDYWAILNLVPGADPTAFSLNSYGINP